MADLIRKVLDCEIKKLGDRNYEFTASTSTQDRDGEVIDAKGWDLRNFKKNPVIMYAHDYRSLPIGKAPKVWLTGGKLKNTVEFPPEGTYEFADIVERLVDKGYLKTESVGFIPKKWEDGDGEKAPKRTYTKQELLEISLVPVPSNPDALRNAVDDGVITTKEFDAITKPEENDDWIRIPVAECNVTATIDISKKEGIKALYCGKEKKVRTYMFDKRPPYNWTMAKAKEWVEAHKGVEEIDEDSGIEVEEKATTQAELMDNLDYIKNIIGEVGLNEEAMKEAWELVREIMRLAGDDIPDDIRDVIGVLISEKHELKVRDTIEYLESYLSGADVIKEVEPVEIPEPKELGLTEQQTVELIQKTVTQVIEKAQGKID